MTDTVLNRCKGRVAEFAERVNANDPSGAVFVLGLLAASGLESHATLRDMDSLTALVAGATNEATNTGYARKVITDSGGITITYDDTNDRVDVDMPDQTWSGPGISNDGTGAVGMAFFAYDAIAGSGTDSDILVMTIHDFALTPDGSDVTIQLNSAGFFRAS